MGEGGNARVEAILPRGASNVVFFAAHGRVENVAMQSPTRVTAKYYKPEGFLPRVDVVAALATVDGENRWGYAAVILFGQGQASLKTRRDAEATVRIGEQVYGPVRADENGYATFQIIVPPGIQEGRDSTNKVIDLNVPIAARTAVFAHKKKIAPEVDREVELFGVVTSFDGSTDEDSAIEITANKGRVDDVHSIGSGAYIGRYTPPKLKNGHIEIESVVPEDDAPPAVLSLQVVPPPWHVEQFTVSQVESPPPAVSQPPVQLLLTPKVGFGINPHNAVSFHFAGDVGTLFPIGGQYFAVGLELGTSYSKADDLVEKNGQRTDVEWTMWFLSVLTCMSWQRELNDKLSINIGLQGGFLYFDSEINAAPRNAISSRTSVKHETVPRGLLGANLSLGWNLGPGTLLGELRFIWAPGDYETLNRSFYSTIIDFGYRIWFL